MRALDVGAGSGPAAVALARAGLRVAALDREPSLLRVASHRIPTSAGRGRAYCVAGDAVALPFGANTFELVVSTFGVMFASDPARAATELVRVCRPGGVIAVASWTPEGTMRQIAPTVLAHLDRPGSSPSPMRWGDAGWVCTWFAPLPTDLHLSVRQVLMRYDSVEHAVRAFENKPRPLRAHRAALRAAGRWKQARAALSRLFEDGNEADDGSSLLRIPYLFLIGHVRET
ncbi:methyltransferase domain-containing protein [Streptomyces marokkonensis]|uniref:methyltransferase domain-containing protein n=1 Tax=Streptomyces marokkonensis TaxID=324855 RepID=UPI00142EF819